MVFFMVLQLSFGLCKQKKILDFQDDNKDFEIVGPEANRISYLGAVAKTEHGKEKVNFRSTKVRASLNANRISASNDDTSIYTQCAQFYPGM